MTLFLLHFLEVRNTSETWLPTVRTRSRENIHLVTGSNHVSELSGSHVRRRRLLNFLKITRKKLQSKKFGDFSAETSRRNFTFGVRLLKSGEEDRWKLLGKRKITLGCADATNQYFLQTANNQCITYYIATCLYILDLKSLTVRFNPCPPSYHSRNLAEAKHLMQLEFSTHF